MAMHVKASYRFVLLAAFVLSGSAGCDSSRPTAIIDEPPADRMVLTGRWVDFEGTCALEEGGSGVITHHWTFGADSGVADSIREDPGAVFFNTPGTFKVTYTCGVIGEAADAVSGSTASDTDDNDDSDDSLSDSVTITSSDGLTNSWVYSSCATSSGQFCLETDSTNLGDSALARESCTGIPSDEPCPETGRQGRCLLESTSDFYQFEAFYDMDSATLSDNESVCTSEGYTWLSD